MSRNVTGGGGCLQHAPNRHLTWTLHYLDTTLQRDGLTGNGTCLLQLLSKLLTNPRVM